MFVLEIFRNPAAQNAQSPQIVNANRTVTTQIKHSYIKYSDTHTVLHADRLRESERKSSLKREQT